MELVHLPEAALPDLLLGRVTPQPLVGGAAMCIQGRGGNQAGFQIESLLPIPNLENREAEVYSFDFGRFPPRGFRVFAGDLVPVAP